MADQLRVLMIKDSEEEACVLQQALQAGGFTPQITRVASPEALQLALAHEAWDVILADYMLPQLSGLVALRLLHEMELDIPFILVSGTIGEETAVEAMRAGAQDYLLKGNLTRLVPVILRELQEARGRQARREAEEALAIVNRGLRMLSAVNAAVLRATDESALLQEICETAVSVGGYRMVWVGLAEHDPAQTVRPISWAGEEAGFLAAIQLTWADTALGRGPTGTAIRTGHPAFVRDIAASPEYAPWREAALQRGYRSSISVPLTINSHVLGALNLYGAWPDAFPPEQVQLLTEMAGNLAYGLMALRTRTQCEATEAHYQREAQRAQVLLDLYTKAPALTEEALYRIALDHAVALTDSTIGFLHRIADDQQTIILTAWNQAALAGCTAPYETHYPVNEAGNWVDALRERRPVVYNDYPHSPHQKGLPTGHPPLQRFMSIPVMAGEHVRLIFGVGNKAALYTDHDVVHLQLVANELQKILTQRHAQEALRESETRFGNAFTYAAIGMALVSPEGRWLKVNPALCAMLDYTEDELLATTFQALTYPDDLESDLAYVQQMLQGQRKTYQMEKRYRHKAGHFIWGRLSVSLVRDAQEIPQYFISQIEDITARKHAEETLRESELLFRLIAENSPDIIFFQDGNLVYRWIVNPARPLSPADVIGKTDAELLPPEEAQRVMALKQRVLASGDTLRDEVDLSPAGEHRVYDVVYLPWRDDAGQVTGVAGYARDITDRQRAEEALRENVQRLRTVLATLPVGVFLIDVDGRIRETNDRVNQIWGGTVSFAESVAGYREYQGWWADTGHPLRPEEWASARALQGETTLGEIIDIQRFDGTRGTILNSATPLRDAEGDISGAVVVIQDITDLREAQHALARERSFLRTVIDTVPNFIGVKDTESRFILANRALADVYGTTPDALIGKSDADVNPNPEEVAWFHRDDLEVMRTRQPKYIPQEKITDNTGRVRWLATVKVPLIEPDGSSTHLILATTDITDRVHAEEAVEEERAFLSSAIELLPFPILFIDPTQAVLRQNQASRTMQRGATDQFWSVIRLLDPQTHREVPPERWPVRRALQGEVVSASEWIVRLPDDGELPILLYSAPIILDEHIRAAVVALQDISALKEADQAKNQFLKVISHEMRTPLTAILGWAQIAADDPTLCAEAIQAIMHSTRVQEHVLDRLILLSRILTGKLLLLRQPTDLWHIAEQSAASGQTLAAERQVTLVCEPPPDPLPVVADPTLLQQALQEVLDNALKYTPTGGRVTITAGCQHGQVRVTVSDTGRGMGPNQLPRVWKPFAQMVREEALGGLGIGLVLVYSILEAHGGQVFITSPGLGQGTTVTLALPALASDGGADAQRGE